MKQSFLRSNKSRNPTHFMGLEGLLQRFQKTRHLSTLSQINPVHATPTPLLLDDAF
jgi:hypothetical protein